MHSNNRELARRWFEEVWNQRSDDTIRELLHPEVVGDLEGQFISGPDEFMAMRKNLLAFLPDLKITVEAIIAEGDHAVVRWHFHATPARRAPVAPAPPTAHLVEVGGMTWLRFRNGQIVEGWDRWNQGALLQQL
jgi:predicted ester cyclase